MSRITASLKIVGLTSSLLLAATASGAAGTPHVLIAVWNHLGSYTGEAFAYVQDGRLTKIPDDMDGDKFDKTYFAEGQRYTLYRGGVPDGSVTVQSIASLGCTGFGADLTADKPDALSWDRMALASDAQLKDSGYVRRDATDAERAAFLRLAADYYAANKVQQAVYQKAAIHSISALVKGQQVILVGDVLAQEPTPKGSSGPGDTDMVFLIADTDGSGAFKRGVGVYDSGPEDRVEHQTFVDTLDIGGDGAPELVIHHSADENSGYDVYRKTGSSWKKIFAAEGAGC